MMTKTLKEQIMETSPEEQDLLMKELMLAHLVRQNGNRVSALEMGSLGPMGYIYWNPTPVRPLPPLSDERRAKFQRIIDTIDDAVDADVFLEQLRQKALQPIQGRSEARVPSYTPEELAQLQHTLNTLDDAVDTDVILDELRLEARLARLHES